MRHTAPAAIAVALCATAALGQILVTSRATPQIAMFTNNGMLIGTMPIPTMLGPMQFTVDQVFSICRSPSGDVHIGDASGYVYDFTPALILTRRYAGGVGPVYGMTSDPGGLLCVSGSATQSVNRFDAQGLLFDQWVLTGGTNLRGMVFDATLSLLVSDFSGAGGLGEINRFDAGGIERPPISTPGLVRPFGIARISDGFLVAEQDTAMLYRFDAARNFVGVLQPPIFGGRMFSIAVDGQDRVFLPEVDGNEVVVVDLQMNYLFSMTAPGFNQPSAVLPVTEACQVSPAACGDCNGDGTISVLDALRAARAAAGLVQLLPYENDRCDVDPVLPGGGDGDTDVLDALLLAQRAAQLPVSLSCCP